MNLRTKSKSRRAFTLVEVLAAILIITIVLPTVMYGITLATQVAGVARHRAEATSLAQAKLNELLITGDWQTGSLNGDFTDIAPEYRWSATLGTWDGTSVTGDTVGTLNSDLQKLDVSVIWTTRGREYQVTLSTLVYSSSSSTGSTQ